MEQKEINIKFLQLKNTELSDSEKRLYKVANNEIKNSYSPYSQFKVACVLSLDNGESVTGTNQENAAFPSGLCAERVAVFYAKSKFPDACIKQVLIMAEQNGSITENPITPCGACLQVLLEAENRQTTPIELLLVGKNIIWKIASVKDCLPIRFEKF
ncbi:MAG: cytidine deaminase [Bacteroidales bacterium]|nr:cytidine deaminase [Bacteroidales bacterium]